MHTTSAGPIIAIKALQRVFAGSPARQVIRLQDEEGQPVDISGAEITVGAELLPSVSVSATDPGEATVEMPTTAALAGLIRTLGVRIDSGDGWVREVQVQLMGVEGEAPLTGGVYVLPAIVLTVTADEGVHVATEFGLTKGDPGEGFDPDPAPWDGDKEYGQGIVLRHGEAAYVSLVANQGVEPGTDAGVWMLLVEDGEPGEPGADGVDGVDGEDGEDGEVTAAQLATAIDTHAESIANHDDVSTDGAEAGQALIFDAAGNLAPGQAGGFSRIEALRHSGFSPPSRALLWDDFQAHDLGAIAGKVAPSGQTWQQVGTAGVEVSLDGDGSKRLSSTSPATTTVTLVVADAGEANVTIHARLSNFLLTGGGLVFCVEDANNYIDVIVETTSMSIGRVRDGSRTVLDEVNTFALDGGASGAWRLAALPRPYVTLVASVGFEGDFNIIRYAATLRFMGHTIRLAAASSSEFAYFNARTQHGLYHRRAMSAHDILIETNART